MSQTRNGGLGLYYPSPPFPARDVAMTPGILPICGKSGMRLWTYWWKITSRRLWWLLSVSSFTVLIKQWVSRWRSMWQKSGSWQDIVSLVRIWMTHSEIVLCASYGAKRFRKSCWWRWIWHFSKLWRLHIRWRRLPRMDINCKALVVQLNRCRTRGTLGRFPLMTRRDHEQYCYRCGKSTHKAAQCPFWTAKCHNFGKTGHLRSVCRQPKKPPKHPRAQGSQSRQKVQLVEEDVNSEILVLY